MRVIHIAPYVGLLVIGQAALDASPLVVAAQEGGMGPGSALIVAYVLQAGGIALAAAAAAYLVDRGSTPAALVAGAVLFAAGLTVAMTAPMGALGWVFVGLGVAGSGFGLILTTAFAVAAGVGGRHRPIAIMLLLLASLAGRIATGTMVLAGPLALMVEAAIVVGISVVTARLSRVDSTRAGSSVADTAEAEDTHRLSAGAALVGGMLLGAGVVAMLAGADSSRVSAFAFAGSLGLTRLDALDGARIGMVVGGMVLVVGGSLLLLRRLRPDTGLRWAVPAIALAALAASGIATGLSLAVTLGGAPSGREVAALAGLAGVGGSALGLVLGAWWLARGAASRTVAIAGSLLLGSTSALGLIAVSGAASSPSDVAVPAAILGMSAFGAALVAVALRLVLAESAVHQRGLAAGAGVVAASFGSALGSLVGTGEATRVLTGDPNAISAGAIVLAAAVLAAVGVVVLMPSRPPA